MHIYKKQYFLKIRMTITDKIVVVLNQINQLSQARGTHRSTWQWPPGQDPD